MVLKLRRICGLSDWQVFKRMFSYFSGYILCIFVLTLINSTSDFFFVIVIVYQKCLFGYPNTWEKKTNRLNPCHYIVNWMVYFMVLLPLLMTTQTLPDCERFRLGRQNV